MTEGVLTLGQVEARTFMLDVVCSHCDRRGCLSTADLLSDTGQTCRCPRFSTC